MAEFEETFYGKNYFFFQIRLNDDYSSKMWDS